MSNSAFDTGNPDVSLLRPVVIDNGTGVVKCGFAGEDRPSALFPNLVGRPKHHKVMASTRAEGDHFTGRDADELRGLLRLSRPMQKGRVCDWHDMEKVWYSVYHTHLRTGSDAHPVLLTESPLNPARNRTRSAEVFFEALNAPALFVSPQAVLSLYASGRTTGCVLDVGEGVTTAVPIYEGYALRHSVVRSEIAGGDVTERLRALLGRAGTRLVTTAEREVAREIKEQTCYIVFNATKEEEKKGESDPAPYILPDGTPVSVGAERFRSPEVLFNPAVVGSEEPGVHEALVSSIARSDMDLRRRLYEQVVLAGGSTLIPGFGDRLLNEVRKMAPRDVKIRITAPPERQVTAWIGGSILASLSTFSQMWVTAAEFQEEGAAAINRKTF